MRIILKARFLARPFSVLEDSAGVISCCCLRNSAQVVNCPEQHVRCPCHDFLLCRTCGHEVAKADNLIKVPSRLAIRQRNDTILGQKDVLIQLFRNPQGAMFEVVTLSASDVFTHDQAFAEYSWFPGYTWQISICPRCGVHLGWFFKPIPISESVEQQSFLGLILGKVIHKSMADSILITPKSFRS